MTARPRCKCGVYESAHLEGRGCGDYRKASRLRLWFLDHGPVAHFTGRLWLALPESWRWRVVTLIHERRPALCWCDLVDSACLSHKRDDYRGRWGCGCDVPLPTDARTPRYGECYCQPPQEAIA